MTLNLVKNQINFISIVGTIENPRVYERYSMAFVINAI